MTKQQVIDILEAYKPSGNIYDNPELMEVKQMDDLISRQAAIDSLLEALHDLYEYDLVYAKTVIVEELKRVPSVQTVQKTGQWLINSDGYYPYCSICKNEPQGRIMTDYCPNCGTKMESEG